MAGGGGSSVGGLKHPVKIFANIFISFIGAGVLGLPYAFKEAGIIEGTLVMTGVGIISIKAMLLLIECKYRILENQGSKSSYSRMREEDDGLKTAGSKDELQDLMRGEEHLVIRVKDPPLSKGEDLSYGDVGYQAMGHTGRFLVDLAIVLSQIGFCCAYLIFIAQNLSDYMAGMKLGHWLMILLPTLCMLTMLRHLGSLAITSLMAQCSNLMAFGVVFWFDFEHFYSIEYSEKMLNNSNCSLHPAKFRFSGLPFFLCIAIYCYEGAGMILSLEASVHEDLRFKFKKYFISTMVLVTTLYITFGACGYLSFGPETNQIITLNLPNGQSVDSSMIVKSFLCLALYFTYPVMMFPVTKILERYFLPDADKQYWKGNIMRAILVVITGFIVMAIPNFAILMALIGASCCILLALVLPGAFHLKIFNVSLTRSQRLINWSLIIMGILGTIVGMWDALRRVAEPNLSTHPEQSDSDGFVTDNTTSTAVSTASAFLTSVVSNAVSTILNISTGAAVTSTSGTTTTETTTTVAAPTT
ncbi:amino acid transporter AVT3B-like isoform X2 [Gigantopelta aegis]|uniref:amino acid transporter AVT3B-like isoform X2 n=1 Tax=Gigantopelta aegis TaxID=1735272 RepID=UPI001B88965C|nr:amino acid transporter AVT3B-like isoform X2 [Gigantopelta aegis]